MVMADIGIITEEQCKMYEAQAEEKTDILREYLQEGERTIMGKDTLKGFLFDILNKNDKMMCSIVYKLFC